MIIMIACECGITESSTDPPANLVCDALGKRRPVGWCGGGSVTAGTTGCGWVLGRVMSIVEHNYIIIDGEGEGGDEIEGCS